MGENNIFDDNGRKQEEKNEENYHFVKEVIKKRTIRPKDIFMRIVYIAGAAVLFGIIAAFVFVHFLPLFQKDEEAVSRVDFEEDQPVEAEDTVSADYPDVETTEEIPVPTKQPSANTPSAPGTATGVPETDPETFVPTENGSGEKSAPTEIYNELYGEMQVIAQEAMRCVVTVTGITNSEDWFDLQSDSQKQASGLIVAENDQELYILTEYKTVDAVERVVVTFCDGTIIDGRYQMHDPNTGLTILKVALSELEDETRDSIKVAALGNSYHVSQGEAVIAIGSPMGYSNSVVYGQITSTANTVVTFDRQYNLFTTNMLGAKAGSGVLINLEGEVIGVIAQGFGDEQHENVILGLPISQLKTLIEILSNGGDLSALGIQGQDVTAEVMDQTGMPKGIYVSALKNNSPALLAGIRNGDIITKYNGDIIETMAEYTEKLSNTETGVVVELTIMRKSNEGYREFVFEIVTAAE